MGPLPDGDDSAGAGLRRVLSRSRDLGLLGDGPLSVHLANGRLFDRALRARAPDDLPEPPSPAAGPVLDLGAGGGVPGLVVALERPSLRVVLLEAQRRRCDFLRWSVEELGLEDRVRVVEARAEDAAHDPDLRGSVDAVMARSFGPPATTAECAVGFLGGPGCRLLVSEPPGPLRPDRWPADGLGRLGLVLGPRVTSAAGSVQTMVLAGPAPSDVPRRSGRPAKRPLF